MGTILKNKKGIALLWTLVICVIMMIITGMMVGYITKDTQSSIRIEESAQSYAAAKSGLDWGLWYLQNPSATSTIIYPVQRQFNIGRAITQVTIESVSGTTVINSTGDVAGVRRKLRYELRADPGCLASNPGVNGLSTQSNFKTQFDFWLNDTNHPFSYGLRDLTGTNMVYMDVTTSGANAQARLVTKVGTKTTYSAGSILPIVSSASAAPYKYRGVIKVIGGIVATLEISERTIISNTETFVPIGSQSISLINNNLGTLTTAYSNPIGGYNPNDVTNPGDMVGDGSYFLINVANYIDNLKINGTSTCP